MSLGASHDGVDACHQLVLVERLGYVVVGTEAEPFDFVLDTGEAERIRTGDFTFEMRSLRRDRRSPTYPEGSDRGG